MMEKYIRYRSRLKEKALTLFLNRCNICHSVFSLQFAHKVPCGWGPGRGSKRRYQDVLRHPWDYVLLCADCHWRLDFCDSDNSELEVSNRYRHA